MPVARVWMQQICEALLYIHERGFVHRDVKPENILLHDGEIRLCDFGLACAAGGACAGKAPGTAPYKAPETWSAHVVSAAQDVWSLGIVLYAILFADLPWEAAVETDADYMRYVGSGLLGSSLGTIMLSKHMFSLLRRMLAPNPADRCTIAEVHEFFSVLRPWFSSDTLDQDDSENKAIGQKHAGVSMGRKVELCLPQLVC